MRIFLIIYCLVTLTFNVFSQSKDELEKQKRENYNNIKFTNELLEKTQNRSKNSYNQLVLLSTQINNRQQLITTINSEIELLENQIDIHQDAIFNLTKDLENIKREYANMVYYSYLHKSSYDKLMFILASNDFNQAYRRLKYFQQYSVYRKNQAQKIQDTKLLLSEEILQIETIKTEKQDLLVDKQIENKNLLSEKNEKNSALKVLKNQERELKIKLKQQYKVAENLQREIERIIEEEARKAAAKLKNSSPDFFQLTPSEQLIAENIIKNKNRLPWPTQRGIITSNFGEHSHPYIKGVIIRNDGVDIATNEGASVRAIFEGTVSRVFVIPGAHKTVIIRHGNYLTVYSNLKDVIVKQGDKVSTKQTIGVVYTDKTNDNKSVLQFQIWRENEKLNPEDWLAKIKNG